ncbi:hypothetical protein Ssi03_47340 [Sphaerisporangium siamense]|uniref:Uncharacterized protein (DUF433 family) n=1 Tax=Sphaerisporangium siamense TaxID=795645 RepID=A0A7W7G823_9ACTN|nr:DUF433 domain-containing protein [Sphaerisporangium siamense]MBB4699129.1 uncharacterized protein (DUF433 family) [Sphaerisporangium siamense]GII86744.1 hypothetical protein Ssi03_47340 [Sphaerisporangium siamense]
MSVVVDLLDRPTYTMSQVDRLIGLPGGTARRWIDGYSRNNRTYEPVVRQCHTGETTVTWGEFIETRLLAEYRDAGVPIINMRPAITKLRTETGSQYPLAHSANFVTPYGKELVGRVQEQVGLQSELLLVVPRNGQLVMADPVELFIKAVEFDEGTAARLLADLRTPAVKIDPVRAFGEPAVRSVPTEVIAEQVRAGDPEELIAELYELPLEQVRQAVLFEKLRSA